MSCHKQRGARPMIAGGTATGCNARYHHTNLRSVAGAEESSQDENLHSRLIQIHSIFRMHNPAQQLQNKMSQNETRWGKFVLVQG
ncbi:MAG: hypothetical protein ACJ788_20675 [Ktedonobacteraceae bacterium]